MKLNSLRALGLSALALVAAVGIAYGATALKLSTGTQFIAGPRLIDGADLNVMLGAVNTLRSQADGTASFNPCSATGASPQTCNASVGAVTTGTLATAALTDAPFTINDSVVTANSILECTDLGYSGTLFTAGNPILSTCVPGAGTITVHISNIHATVALNGTVKIGFTVRN